MGDFHQPAALPTFHHLTDSAVAAAKSQAALRQYAAVRPLALVLPALFEECEGAAFPAILQQVREVDYLQEIVVCMNRMNLAQAERAIALLKRELDGRPAKLLWCDGPVASSFWQELKKHGGPAYRDGKGTNIWMALAYLYACGFDGAVVSHDTDIVNYSSDIIWKLALPLLHPLMGYRFAKGYYSRVNGRMYGRVTRLLCYPLLQALGDFEVKHEMLSFMQALRYPLAGEFGADLKVLTGAALRAGWGLEISLLAEMQRALTESERCQVDLAFAFEHRHRDLSAQSGVDEGFMRAAGEVMEALLLELVKENPGFAAASVRQDLTERYRVRAGQCLERYRHESLLNGLAFDEKQESLLVDQFADSLKKLLETDSWARVESAGDSGKLWSVQRVAGLGAEPLNRIKEAAILV